MIEEVLRTLEYIQWLNVVLLRYFNSISVSKNGLIGENPNGILNNFHIFQTAMGIRQEFGVFCNDCDTHDGTGVRDCIHVADIACGHVAAFKAIES